MLSSAAPARPAGFPVGRHRWNARTTRSARGLGIRAPPGFRPFVHSPPLRQGLVVRSAGGVRCLGSRCARGPVIVCCLLGTAHGVCSQVVWKSLRPRLEGRRVGASTCVAATPNGAGTERTISLSSDGLAPIRAAALRGSGPPDRSSGFGPDGDQAMTGSATDSGRSGRGVPSGWLIGGGTNDRL